ncbi:hypothetical protein SESBI_35019 [Sesbania bispinosa]|nr:hypothetical protein SESBI_35019 [Sesbania bispinosa]
MESKPGGKRTIPTDSFVRVRQTHPTGTRVTRIGMLSGKIENEISFQTQRKSKMGGVKMELQVGVVARLSSPVNDVDLLAMVLGFSGHDF